MKAALIPLGSRTTLVKRAPSVAVPREHTSRFPATGVEVSVKVNGEAPVVPLPCTRAGSGPGDGLMLGDTDGDTDGDADGDTDGLTEGLTDADGDTDGDTDGDADGDTDGDLEGEVEDAAIKYFGI